MGDKVSFLTIKESNRLDAEFFSPKFLEVRNRVENKENVRLFELCEFIRTGPAGSVLKSSMYLNDGIKVYRPTNLNGWTCKNGSFVYVSDEFCEERGLLFCKSGDILVGRVGDVKFGIVENDRSTISSNIILIRAKSGLIDPYFLLAFLNHEDGFGQIERGRKRVSLASVTTSHVGNIFVPKVTFAKQKKIGNFVREALKRDKEAKVLYERAQDLLMRSIEFESFGEGKATRLVKIGDLKERQRADAEFFVFKREGKKKLDKVEFVVLGKIAKISRGIEVGSSKYEEGGKLFIRASNIDKFGLIDKSQKFILSELHEKLLKKYQPKIGEILLVKDGKPGVACLVRDFFEGIISESIVRLVVDPVFSSEYVFLCINSPFCQEQILVDKDGTLQPHLKVERIEKLRIPLVEREVQDEVTRLIRDSNANFDLSKRYLKEAMDLFSLGGCNRS